MNQHDGEMQSTNLDVDLEIIALIHAIFESANTKNYCHSGEKINCQTTQKSFSDPKKSFYHNSTLKPNYNQCSTPEQYRKTPISSLEVLFS